MNAKAHAMLVACLSLSLLGCQANGGFLDPSKSGGDGGGGGSGTDPDISPTDDDGDGVANDVDRCPGTGPNLVVDADGCSVYQLDSDGGDADADGQPDGDGVVDAYDLCPGTTAEQAAAGVDENGCNVDQYGAGNALPEGFVCTDSKLGDAEAGTPGGAVCTVEGLLGPELLTTITGEPACGVKNEDFAVDGDLTTFAEMHIAASATGLVPAVGDLLGSEVSINVVSGDAAVGNAGDLVAFVIAYPASNTGDVSLIDSIVVTTSLGGTVQETRDDGNFLQLGLLNTGVTGVDGSDQLIGFIAAQAFDQVQIAAKGDLLVADVNVSLLGDTSQVLQVKSACADAEIDPASQVAP